MTEHEALKQYLSELLMDRSGDPACRVSVDVTDTEKASLTDPASDRRLLLRALEEFVDSDGAGGSRLLEQLNAVYVMRRRKKKSDSPFTVHTEKGETLLLGDEIGRGGEGVVRWVKGNPDIVAKIYRGDILNNPERLAYKERKLRSALRYKDITYMNGRPLCAFPQNLLYNKRGVFCGFTMPFISTSIKIFDVYRKESRQKFFPLLDYRGLIAVAYNLACAVDSIHGEGLVIGDLNQNNIAVSSDGLISFLDFDSFDFRDLETNEHFPCTVGMAEILAPELQGSGPLSQKEFTRESDSFSLAIHIFRLLMYNADPFGGIFDIIGGTSSSVFANSNAILDGECPYVREVPGKRIPPGSPDLNTLPDRLQELFIRTFRYDAFTMYESISRRPTAHEWGEALMEFYKTPLKQCDRVRFHRYLPKYSSCPYCRAEKAASERRTLSPPGGAGLTVGL